MKQAPVRGLRCLPGERIGNRSGGWTSWYDMAAPKAASGLIPGKSAPVPTATPAQAGLRHLTAGPHPETARPMDVHLICDNYSTHNTEAIKT